MEFCQECWEGFYLDIYTHTCVEDCSEIGWEWVNEVDPEFYQYMQLYLGQLQNEFDYLCTTTGADCDGFVDFFGMDNIIPPGNVCKCAPYYMLNTETERCESIKNLMPHCV